jgi:hypothetical protein
MKISSGLLSLGLCALSPLALACSSYGYSHLKTIISDMEITMQDLHMDTLVTNAMLDSIAEVCDASSTEECVVDKDISFSITQAMKDSDPYNMWLL